MNIQLKNRHNELNFALLIGILAIDYFSKHLWSAQLGLNDFPKTDLPLFFQGPWRNLSSFILLLVSICTILMHFTAVRLIHRQWFKMKYGITLISAGLLILFMDLGIRSGVVEFFSFEFPSFFLSLNSPILLGMSGSVLFISGLIIDLPKLRKMNFFRYRYLIRPKEQIHHALIYAGINFLSLFIGGAFAYTYFFLKIEKEAGLFFTNGLFEQFLVYFSFLALAICTIGVVASIFLSHKSVGPIYAFHKFIDDLIEGNRPWFQLRDDDQHKELERIAQKLIVAWEGHKRSSSPQNSFSQDKDFKKAQGE